MKPNDKDYLKFTDIIARGVLDPKNEEQIMMEFDEAKFNKSEDLKIEFLSLISRLKKHIQENPNFFMGYEDDTDVKFSKIKRLINNLKEEDRIENLINHKMEFFNPNMTNEQRIEMFESLTDMDKEKLIQLEASLHAKTTGEFNHDPYGFYKTDEKFLASFSDSEINIFRIFVQSLSEETKTTRTR